MAPKKKRQASQNVAGAKADDDARTSSARPERTAEERTKAKDVLRRLVQRVEELLVQGVTITRIHEYLTMPDEKGRVEFPGLTRGKVLVIHRSITTELAKAAREQQTPSGIAVARRMSLKRLHHLRQWAFFGEKTPDGKDWLRKPDGSLALACEKQIARLEGIEAPRKIDLNVDVQASAVAEILVNLDGEALTEMEAEVTREEAMLRVKKKAGIAPKAKDADPKRRPN